MRRREFLRSSLAGTAALVVTGCRNDQHVTKTTRATRQSYARHTAEQTGATRDVHLVAAPSDVDVGSYGTYRTCLYEGQFPGPEIRVMEGDRLRVELENRLPDATTIHWHGVPVPNSMDGVPNLTQAPIATGTTFLYDFVAAPAGSYMYH